MRRPGPDHPLLLGDVLLEDVVLDGPTELVLRDPLLLRDRDVRAEREDRAGVDGHAGGDPVERDSAEEHLEVLQRGDGDALPPHFAARHRVVGVVAHQGRHVEGGAQAGHAVLEQVLEALIVSSGVPNPANWRIVHSRPRYMLGCGPRVYGNCPGNPRSRWYFSTSASLGSPASAGVSKSGIGMPESVWNPGWRMGLFCAARARSVLRHS